MSLTEHTTVLFLGVIVLSLLFISHKCAKRKHNVLKKINKKNVLMINTSFSGV